MKKLVFTLAVLFCVVTLNAQESRMWVGGTVGLWSSKVKGGDSQLSFKVKPEFGYILNDNLAVGIVIGAGHTYAGKDLKFVDVEEFGSRAKNVYTVNPFVRYSFLKGTLGALFVDGGIAWNHYNPCGGEDDDENQYEVGLRPGIAINVSEKVALIGKFGFLGYQHTKVNEAKRNDFGFDFDMNNIELGMCVKF